MSAQRVLAVFAATLLGCAGSYGGKPRTKGGAAMPAGGIEAAALPYQIVDARTGRQIDTAAFWTQLEQARAVCIGEDHSNPHHHLSLIHISEPTRLLSISYAVFCL